MACPTKAQKPSASIAREQFIQNVRRDLTFNLNATKTNPNKPGTLLAKAVRYNDSLDRLKGCSLIKKGQKEWLWEVEGEPGLIDRRLGGLAKRSRDKSPEEDDANLEVENGDNITSQITHRNKTAQVNRTTAAAASSSSNTLLDANNTSKRARTNGASLGAKVAQLLDQAQHNGPSSNTRSRASNATRAGGSAPSLSSGRSRTSSTGTARQSEARRSAPRVQASVAPCPRPDPMAEIIAGIDSFSVFSNDQIDTNPINGLIITGPATEMPAQAFEPAANVGNWLDYTLQAGPQAPIDANRSAPSSIAGISF